MVSDIERLIAVEDIKFMRASFCQALDRRDFTALEAMLTPDAKILFSDESGHGLTQPVELNGRAAFSAFVKEFTGTAKMVHTLTSPQIEIRSADTAHGFWYCEGYSAASKERGLAIGIGYETLEDDYVRVNGKWLIKNLTARIQAVM